MNLLDQKVKEKLLLFSNNDSNLIQTTSAQQELRLYYKTENHLTNASTKQYDLLYSNFFDNNLYHPRIHNLGISKTKKFTSSNRPKPTEYTSNRSNTSEVKVKKNHLVMFLENDYTIMDSLSRAK